ncbi:unnamed protein product [Urochloa humidicola]
MAGRFTERSELARNAAWSATGVEDDVPADRVFSRLKSALSSPSVEDVELALDALQLVAAADQGAPAGDDGSSGMEAALNEALSTGREGDLIMGLDDAALLGLSGAAGCPGPCDGPTQGGLAGVGRDPAQGGPVEANSGPPEGDGPDVPLLGQIQDDAAAAVYDDGDALPEIDDLFTAPASPLHRCPPVRAPRRRWGFDMSAVRRSARLAAKPAMPSLQRAQNNLLRKLGLQVDDHTPIEEVLREYVKSITGPLPEYIIAALATLLDLDDDDKDKMTKALLQHAGDGVAELQEEQEALMLHDD